MGDVWRWQQVPCYGARHPMGCCAESVRNPPEQGPSCHRLLPPSPRKTRAPAPASLAGNPRLSNGGGGGGRQRNVTLSRWPVHSPNPSTAGTGCTATGDQGWHLHLWTLHLVKATICGCRTSGELHMGRDRHWDTVWHMAAQGTRSVPSGGFSMGQKPLGLPNGTSPPNKHNVSPVPPLAPSLSPWGHHVGLSLAVTAGSRWWHGRAGAHMATAPIAGGGTELAWLPRPEMCRGVGDV